eukprot:scaffold211013_cov39-Tisochrysis_lutea.AAC.2
MPAYAPAGPRMYGTLVARTRTGTGTGAHLSTARDRLCSSWIPTNSLSEADADSTSCCAKD